MKDIGEMRVCVRERERETFEMICEKSSHVSTNAFVILRLRLLSDERANDVTGWSSGRIIPGFLYLLSY